MKRLFKKNKMIELLSFLIVAFSSCSFFLGGSQSTDSHFEMISDYATNVVLNKTRSHSYCSITVQSDSKNVLPDPYREFVNLYGVFKQQKATFGSAINFLENDANEKEHSIFVKHQSEKLSDNLSMFYVGPVGSVEYQGHFKIYTYPFELMFNDVKKYDLIDHKYIVYINQEHADRILEKFGEQKTGDSYSQEQYFSLLDNPERRVVDIEIDGRVSKFLIQNIFYKKNYYFKAMQEVLGDFVLCSYFLPNDISRERKNMYFFSEYAYQNKYFMKYIDNVYSNGEFDIRVNHLNITETINDNLLLDFYYKKSFSNNQWLAVGISIVSIVNVIFALFVSIFWASSSPKKIVLLHGSSFLFVYFLFFIIFKVTRFSRFFSGFSCAAFLICLFNWIICFAALVTVKNNKHRKAFDSNEINI